MNDEQPNLEWGVSKEDLLRHVSTVIANMERLQLQSFSLMLGACYFFSFREKTPSFSEILVVLVILAFLTTAYYFIYSNLMGHYLWIDIHIAPFKAKVVKEVGRIYQVFHLIAFIAPAALLSVQIFVMVDRGWLSPKWFMLVLFPLVCVFFLRTPFRGFLNCMSRHITNPSITTFSEDLEKRSSG